MVINPSSGTAYPGFRPWTYFVGAASSRTFPRLFLDSLLPISIFIISYFFLPVKCFLLDPIIFLLEDNHHLSFLDFLYLYYNIFFFILSTLFFWIGVDFLYDMPRYPIRFKLSGAQRAACSLNCFSLTLYIYIIT
jgi:hypothetical protein